MDKVVFSWRGERPNGKHLLYKRCFSFPVKVEHIPFLNLTVTQHFTTPAVVVPRNVSCFLFLFHLAEFIHFAQNLFPRGICRRTDSDENVVRGIGTKKFALRLIRHPAIFFCQKNKHKRTRAGQLR